MSDYDVDGRLLTRRGFGRLHGGMPPHARGFDPNGWDSRSARWASRPSMERGGDDAEIHDFGAGLNFEVLAAGCGNFHDWAIREFKIFAAGDDANGFDGTEPRYDAGVILRDPCRCFEKPRGFLKPC